MSQNVAESVQEVLASAGGRNTLNVARDALRPQIEFGFRDQPFPVTLTGPAEHRALHILPTAASNAAGQPTDARCPADTYVPDPTGPSDGVGDGIPSLQRAMRGPKKDQDIPHQ